MTEFITNTDKTISEVIKNILPTTRNFYALVGYFYFSGFSELYKGLKDKNVKILIGMNIEPGLKNTIKEIDIIGNNQNYKSNLEIRNNVYKSFVNIINNEHFDNEEFEKSFNLFVEKMENGTLEIRKTMESNHAKLYIFENGEEYNQNGEYPGTIITGSSNLSISGLKNRFEINVIIRDKPDYEEALDIFNKLWDKSEKIVNRDNIEKFFVNVRDKTWVIKKLPKPYLMYLRLLKEYFAVEEQNNLKYPSFITEEKYWDLEYQKDAIKKTISTIKKHNGVIISDVVGLGKSIIASTVAFNLNVRKIVIITPPHLNEQWKEYSRYFDLTNATIYTSGKIEEAYNDWNHIKNKLIIIDEAHKYRNEKTINYGNLHKLCQSSRVILITATPFNNKPQDIFAMIKLFQIPSMSTIRTVDNLYEKFKELIGEYKEIDKNSKKIKDNKNSKDVKNQKERIRRYGKRIRDIISPFIIRRTRVDLEKITIYKNDLEKQGIQFPVVEDPMLLDYKLGDLRDLYIKTLEKISPQGKENKKKAKGLVGARYKPVVYLKNFEKYKNYISQEIGDYELFKQSQVNIADLMRLLLVRRFESSIASFQKSIENMIDSNEKMLSWYRAGHIPVYKKGELPDVEELKNQIEEDLKIEINSVIFNEEFVELTRKRLARLEEKGLWFIPSKEVRNQFEKDILKDIKILREIGREWFGEIKWKDPKLDQLKNILEDKIKNDKDRKIVVFTEFQDTAGYLYRELKKSFRCFVYTSQKSSKQNKETIRTNFDAGISKKEQKNDYDILIATDAISEGYNLHRAGAIFNYDIPYNPTRVIQRAGRINRINKKMFDKIYIYNYFPSLIGEKETSTKRISTLKLSIIQALLGSDTKYLTSDEEIKSVFTKDIKKAMRDELEEESWDTQYINLFKSVNDKKILKEIDKIPPRTRIRRQTNSMKKGVVVFAKKGDNYTFKFSSNGIEIKTLESVDAIKMFEADINEKPYKTSEKFKNVYLNIKKELFVHNVNSSLDKGERDAVHRIILLEKRYPEYKDYFNLLRKIIVDFNALPKVYITKINKINLKKELLMKNDINQLIKEVPEKYLMDITNRANETDIGKEEIIFSEEIS
jgi:ERCC4-related helicase